MPANKTGPRFKTALLSIVLTLSTMQAVAHEYWIDPVDTQWTPGSEVQADIRNGQEFVGNALPFQPDAFSRAGLISNNDRRALSGRLGDYPAFRMALQEEGLHLLLLETTQRELHYDDYSAFETFLNYHGLQDIAERHQSRGLPRQDIVERYYRYCKSLIRVEAATAIPLDTTPTELSPTPTEALSAPTPALAAQDQRLELVAQGNPLQSDTLRLQLLFEGEVLVDRQVELFHRDSENTVTRTIANTDDMGLVEFPTDNEGDYLVNSVKVVEPADTSAHWETLWASLTFRKNKPDLP